jgi:TRAP-type mannitol/chloroaromatic compound transport system permease small subunit
MYGNFAGVDLICSLMHQRHVSVVRWFAHALHALIDTLQLILLLIKNVTATIYISIKLVRMSMHVRANRWLALHIHTGEGRRQRYP